MKIAFVGGELERTEKAFKTFISENSKDIKIATDNRLTLKDDTIIFIAAFSNLELLDGEIIDEIIWVPPMVIPTYKEAVEYVRSKLSSYIPKEFTEWVYDYKGE